MTNQLDRYQVVTDSIIDALKKGTRPWMQSWSHPGTLMSRPLRVTGESYSGINVLILWAAAEKAGFKNSTWMTYKHAASLGGYVRRHEKGTHVVFAQTRTVEQENDDGDLEQVNVPSHKWYTVFNVEQIDGLPSKFYIPAPVTVYDKQRDAAVDKFFHRLGATIRHGGSQAYYCHESDQVQMPPFELFHDTEGYYAVLAHECVHWTGHTTRLDRRTFGAKRWGDEGYAMEELVAELGSCFLSADLGLQIMPREDHASYIESWLKVLKNDKRAIFTAASYAQKAVRLMHDKQGSANIEALAA